eukprot:5633943-Lingulodinium_polyedra.AAC.1
MQPTPAAERGTAAVPVRADAAPRGTVMATSRAEPLVVDLLSDSDGTAEASRAENNIVVVASS